MSDATEMDRVIERVKKILARTKTTSGVSDAEADNATRLVQKLLMEHNLDMATIEAQNNLEATAVERVKEEHSKNTKYKWQRSLAKYVAEANFCYHLIKFEYEWIPSREVPCEEEGDHTYHAKCYTRYVDGSDEPRHLRDTVGRQKATPRHIFVGRKANVITAQLMFQYLVNAVEEQLPITNHHERHSRSAMSWKDGCAERLCERLAKKREDLIKEHDARVQAEEAARKAEAQAAYEAKQKGKAKELPANEGAEVKATVDDLLSSARHGHATRPDGDAERPEADPDDTWNPSDEEEQPEEQTGTALVLASVYDDKEREANWELANGYEPGSLARMRAEREERRRKQAEEEATEQATEETEKIEAPVKQETERQRAARERREAEAYAKRRRRWAREDATAARKEEREYAKKDHAAFAAGAKVGDKIGLDLQVGAASDARKLGR